jgi:Rha family phage regulatory protein
MNPIPVADLTAFISISDQALVTDSRAVAIAFGKKHQHVMRTIRAMRSSGHPEIAEHALSNFGQSSFSDSQGKVQPMFRMTAKGLSELAMSFSGEKSRVIRIRFINAFEVVAQRLADRDRSITEQLHALSRREAPSELKGRIGSLLMNERKREKPELAAARSALEALAQPSPPELTSFLSQGMPASVMTVSNPIHVA